MRYSLRMFFFFNFTIKKLFEAFSTFDLPLKYGFTDYD